jgi:hypothetical protein
VSGATIAVVAARAMVVIRAVVVVFGLMVIVMMIAMMVIIVWDGTAQFLGDAAWLNMLIHTVWYGVS